LAEHKFKIGQLVYFKPEKLGRPAHDFGPGAHQIIKRLTEPQGFLNGSILKNNERSLPSSNFSGVFGGRRDRRVRQRVFAGGRPLSRPPTAKSAFSADDAGNTSDARAM
jgi:hypothetical protein